MIKTDCKFFGVQGPALEKTRACKICDVGTKKLCTNETKILEATSVIVVDGETQYVLNQKKKIEPAPDVSDDLAQDNVVKTQRVQHAQPNESAGTSRLPRVSGVIKKCVELMEAEEQTETILFALSQMYIDKGYPKDKAEARAKGIHRGQINAQKK